MLSVVVFNTVNEVFEITVMLPIVRLSSGVYIPFINTKIEKSNIRYENIITYQGVKSVGSEYLALYVGCAGISSLIRVEVDVVN